MRFDEDRKARSLRLYELAKRIEDDDKDDLNNLLFILDHLKKRSQLGTEPDEDYSDKYGVAYSKKRNLEVDSPLPRINLFPKRKKTKLEVAAMLPKRLPQISYSPHVPQIVITSKGGKQLYAFANVDDLRYRDPCPAFWFGKEAELKNTNPSLCKISSILDAEIRLNGVKIATLDDADGMESLTDVGDTHASMFFTFHSATHKVKAWKGRTITVHIGFNDLPHRMRETIYIEDLTDDEISQVRFDSIEVSTLEYGQ